ncbi:MAG TPA: hypothetical protein VF937_17615, partial [Chloroflexota bacterium]
GAISVTDTLPAGLTFVSGAGANWSCSAVGQSMTCGLSSTLTPGVNSLLMLTLGVGPSAAPSVTNTACVATTGDPNAANNCDTRVIPVPPSASVVMLGQPQRLADTRGSGGPIASGASQCFQISGLAGIPSDAAAVMLNVTGVGYNTEGWLTLYPNGQPVPATSTVNFDKDQYAIANGAIVRLGTSGQVCVNVGTLFGVPGSAHAILDATGYVTSTGLQNMPMLTQPQRVADTRGSGGPISSGSTSCFTVAGVSGIPADAAGVILNVTAANYNTDGWLTLYPNGQSLPGTSTVNFDPSEYAIANGAIVRIGTSGQVCVNVGTINAVPGSAQVILDAAGYLTAAGLQQIALLPSPQRLADTRAGGGPLTTGQSRCFQVTGQAGIPSNALGVILNMTGVGQTAQGWLTVYPNGQPVPATSTLNSDVNEYAIANGVIVSLGAGGQVCVNLGTINGAPGSSNAILDVVGYLAP